MTTKIKATAYRIAGGSKTVYSAEFEEKALAFNNLKKQTEKLTSLIANMVTDNLATELKQKVSKNTADMGMNKFEKVGQAIYKYFSLIEDHDSAAVLQKAKEVFNKAGQEHRSFRKNVLEKVQDILKEWNDTSGKNACNELKTLDNNRDELDCAINKLRKNPDDAEVQEKKQSAEIAFQEQLEKTKKLLDTEIEEAQLVIVSAMINLMDVMEIYNKNMRKIFREGAK